MVFEFGVVSGFLEIFLRRMGEFFILLYIVDFYNICVGDV